MIVMDVDRRVTVILAGVVVELELWVVSVGV